MEIRIGYLNHKAATLRVGVLLMDEKLVAKRAGEDVGVTLIFRLRICHCNVFLNRGTTAGD